MRFFKQRDRALLLAGILAIGLICLSGCGDKGTGPKTKYAVTISSSGTGPAGDGRYTVGERVFISAGTPPAGYTFYNWTVDSGSVSLGDPMSVATWFMMPANVVSLTANFRQNGPVTVLPTYLVTISSEGAGFTGAGIYTVGDTVYIDAGTPPPYVYRFDSWETKSNGVVFDSARNAATWFIMPTNTVFVTARFINKDAGGTLGIGRGGPHSCGNRECRTVVIDGKKWMAENLNRMPDSGNSWCYGNMSDSCDQYGRLYDLETAKTICPTGWHLPTRREWGDLAIFAGGTTGEPGFGGVNYGTNGPAGTALKSTTGWRPAAYEEFCADTPEILCGNGTDIHGFSARPGGVRFSDGSFADAGYTGIWWMSDNQPRIRTMFFNAQSFSESPAFHNDVGYSVRCVAD